jgi:hypothetical protein
MYCYDKAEVKRCIRLGMMAHGLRKIGYTQAILEIIHEDHQGNALMICASPTLVQMAKLRYRNLYSSDTAPAFCVPQTAEHYILGQDKAVYVDSFDLVSAEMRAKVHELLRGRVAGAW